MAKYFENFSLTPFNFRDLKFHQDIGPVLPYAEIIGAQMSLMEEIWGQNIFSLFPLKIPSSFSPQF